MARKKKTQLLITLPKGWGDLTPDAVIRVARYMESTGDRAEELIKLAADLSDLKIRHREIFSDGKVRYWCYHRNTGNVLLDAEQIDLIVESMKWVEGEISLMAAPSLAGYASPDNRLYGVSLEQFVTAEAASAHYIKTRSLEALSVCAAALYPRSEFSAECLSAEARRIARFSGCLPAVFLWFVSAKKYLAGRYPFVFSGSEEGGSQSGSEMLLSMLSSLNGGDTTKNADLKSTELHEVLYELNLKIKNSQNNG